MSSSQPPTYNVGIFIPQYWRQDGTGLTQAYADAHYLKFPTGQGTESIPALIVSGTSTLGSVSLSSLSAPTSSIITSSVDNSDVALRTKGSSFQSTAGVLNLQTDNYPITKSTLISMDTGKATITTTGTGNDFTFSTPPVITTAPATGDNSTKVPTTSWVNTAISAGSTPSLASVMSIGNSASTTLNMNSYAISNITTATAANTGDLSIQGWSGNGTTAGGVNIQSNDNGALSYQGIVSVNADTTYQAYLQGTINAGSGLIGSQFGVNYASGFTCNGLGQNPILTGANSGVSTALTIQPSIIINNPSGNPTISGQNNGSATSLVVSTGLNTPQLTISNLGQPQIYGQNTGNNSAIQVPYGILDNVLNGGGGTGTITLTTSALYNQNYFTGSSANITLKLPSTTLQPNGAWLGICFAPNTTTARTMTIQNSGGTTISVLTSGTTAYQAGTSATSVRMVISGGNWWCF